MADKIIFNIVQVLVVMFFSPLVKGVLNQLKEKIGWRLAAQHFPALSGSLETLFH